MAVELKHVLKLSQQLVITPQLQQAIRILQLSHLELRQEIRQVLLENPCLVEDEDDVVDAEDDTVDLDQLAQNIRENRYEDVRGSVYGEKLDPSSTEQNVTEVETLGDHLKWQISLIGFSEQEKLIANHIIGNLDEDGFLKTTLEAIADVTGESVEQVEKILLTIQQLDPVGVAARDTRECLLIQLNSLEVRTKAVVLATRIIREYFNDFLHRRIKQIARRTGVERACVLEAYQVVGYLSPKPGQGFHRQTMFSEGIVPDLIVKAMPNGEFVVSLYNSDIPNVRISRSYMQMVSPKSDSQSREFVRNKLRMAILFVRSIEQRHNTMLRVMETIVRLQREYFLKGPLYLKPLVLRDVSEEVNMHESTISRVTRGKYVQTPHGLVELKYFFYSGIKKDANPPAAESIKFLIKDIIHGEDPTKPYTDNIIVEKLARRGICVARRTVAKYREMMGIMTSAARRKVF